MRNFLHFLAGVVLLLFSGSLAGSPSLLPLPDECQNDDVCSAVDLGQLAGGTLGDAGQGRYDNLCAGNSGEKNPAADGAWSNDAGVWFSFRTGADVSPLVVVEALSDPEGAGDPINLELAVYRIFGSDCNATLRFEEAVSPGETADARLELYCLRSNTTYFILVDGAAVGNGSIRGQFGLQVREVDVIEAPDTRCRPEFLGPVPPGGRLDPGGFRSNFCATSFGDPPPSSFVTQVSVWFTFRPPPSGHVLIEALTAGAEIPLGVQLALFHTSTNTCTGTFTEVVSIYTDEDYDERLEATCLDPDSTYWLLVDGFGAGGRGMFTLSVADAGDITPVTRLDTTLCAGQSLLVGASVYTRSGSFADTLETAGGCDSVVLTRLTVLDPVEVTIRQLAPATFGQADGVAVAAAAGGAGGYAFNWCDGLTTARNGQLRAGDTCAVAVTDTRGCRGEAGLRVAFTTRILPSFISEPARCRGDSTGAISLSASNGVAPYNYRWQRRGGGPAGEGALSRDGEPRMVPNLPAGDYDVTVTDAYGDTTFQVKIADPPVLSVGLVEQRDASCSGVCDGLVQVSAAGGTGNLRFTWNNVAGNANRLTGLCAGAYTATVSDANNCRTSITVQVAEPPAFTATAAEVRPVSCFGGKDGAAEVTTDGRPAGYAWSNGSDSARVGGLAAGAYKVTVTNEDGCRATASVKVTQPSAPLAAQIAEERPISCAGAADGRLRAVGEGPFRELTYRWSNGIAAAVAEGLPAGDYSVIITNEKGCTATTSRSLTQPPPLTGRLAARDLTCLDPENGGAIRIEDAAGGRPGYRFSLNGGPFQSSPDFLNLYPGEYEVVIEDASGCTEKLAAAVLGPPELFVELGGDRSLQLGEELELLPLSNSEDLLYFWEMAGEPMPESGPMVRVQPLASTVFRLSVEDTVTFCTATDQVRVTVRRDRKVYAPNAFSPDGDGTNDLFTVFGGKGTVRVHSFRIFARNGALVHQAFDFLPGDEAAGWDGAVRGREAPTGVYVYMAEIEFLDGRVEVFKGDVALVR